MDVEKNQVDQFMVYIDVDDAHIGVVDDNLVLCPVDHLSRKWTFCSKLLLDGIEGNSKNLLLFSPQNAF